MTEQRTYQLHHAPTPESMTLSGHADEEVSFFSLQSLIPLHIFIWDNEYLVFLQVVPIQMGELRSLYSWASNNYSFLTHVAHDPVSHNRAYWRLLNSWTDASSFRGSESDQSNPSVAQVPFGGCPPHGPSRLGSRERTPPPPDVEGSASRRRRWE